MFLQVAEHSLGAHLHLVQRTDELAHGSIAALFEGDTLSLQGPAGSRFQSLHRLDQLAAQVEHADPGGSQDQRPQEHLAPGRHLEMEGGKGRGTDSGQECAAEREALADRARGQPDPGAGGPIAPDRAAADHCVPGTPGVLACLIREHAGAGVEMGIERLGLGDLQPASLLYTSPSPRDKA